MSLISRIRYLNRFSTVPLRQNDLIIIDKKLLRFPTVKSKLRNFSYHAVSSGEQLKDIKNFPAHIEKILKLSERLSLQEMRIVAIGGGSVGDFCGFVASVFKRGVELVHVPSTWLAALDSSHGGKNALNVGTTKNQIGTFYAASDIFICKDLLFLQPANLARDAFGELLKTALLDPKLANSKIWNQGISAVLFWKFLRQGIQYKYSIVKRDPYEKKNIRTLLNFGHTMGHAFEILAKWPHGKAVFYGLTFDLLWSYHLGLMKRSDVERILNSNLWSELFKVSEYQKILCYSPTKIRNLINKDKKKTSAKVIKQVFLKGPGKPMTTKVPLESLLHEYERQKNAFC